MCKQQGCEIFYVKLMNYYYFEKKKGNGTQIYLINSFL